MSDSIQSPYMRRKNHAFMDGAGGRTRLVTKGVEVVYYVQMPGTGHIKIGTSADFLNRIRHHGLPGMRGKDAVLAIEFGGRDLERQRHQEFATDRIGRTEQFAPSDALMAHIQSLREALNLTA